MINGKNIGEVLKALAKYEPPKGELKRGKGKSYPFYKVWQYEERLNSVLGVDHYNVSYTEPNIVTLKSGQEVMNVNCRITVLDDDYNPLFFKEGCGSKELQYTNDTDRYDGASNLAHNASVGAFKSACKAFGVFGEGTDEDEFSSSKQPPKAEAMPEKPKADETFNEFWVDVPSEIVKSDKNGLPIYKARGHLIAGKVMQSEKSEILFYPNQYQKKYTGLVNELCNIKSGKKFAFRVSPCGDKAYVFKGLAMS